MPMELSFFHQATISNEHAYYLVNKYYDRRDDKGTLQEKKDMYSRYELRFTYFPMPGTQ